MAQMREDHPGIHFQIYSGNAEDVLERLEKGLLDFGVLVEPVDVSRYNSLRLPTKDTWGLILRRDHPLAQKSHIQREDLTGIPLIVSRQDMASQKAGNDYLDWFGRSYESLDIVAGYSLMYNGALMVKSGIGCAVGLDQVVNTTETSDLCFRPFDPPLEAGTMVIWKKYQVFSKPAEVLLEKMMAAFGE
jgi:DNA-binding transcriptional LysR family regulator